VRQIFPFSSIRTVTVGFGFAPNLLTPPIARRALAGFGDCSPSPPVGTSTPPRERGRTEIRPIRFTHLSPVHATIFATPWACGAGFSAIEPSHQTDAPKIADGCLRLQTACRSSVSRQRTDIQPSRVVRRSCRQGSLESRRVERFPPTLPANFYMQKSHVRSAAMKGRRRHSMAGQPPTTEVATDRPTQPFR
jgi:hypothetical protein